MRKPWLMSLVCLTAAIVLMLTTMNTHGSDAAQGSPHRVVLLAESETGSFYMQLRQGAQDAAGRLGAELSIEVIDSDAPDVQIEGLADDGVRAALVLAERGGLCAQIASLLHKNGILSVTPEDDAGDYAVEPDEVADAHLLAETAKQTGRTRALTIGGSDAVRQAFAATWGGECMALGANFSALDIREGDCVIAFTKNDTLAVMDMKRSGAMPKKVPLFGVDTGNERANDLESGLIQGMLLRQPYATGYLMLSVATQALKGTHVEHVTIDQSRLVTPDTMYRPENVNAVFPLLQ